MRPLCGIRNTLRDFIHLNSECSVKNYPGLMLIKFHFDKIKEEFEAVHPTLKKSYYHNVSPWFEKNENYYFYKIKDFPMLNSLVKQIACIDTQVAAFAVSEGPMRLYAHRAESNRLLRYHITIQDGGKCTLYTEGGSHQHEEGEEFIFDHSRYHELVKTGEGKRVVLILDINR
tara:strand:+ start:220 stop:738 length:519 start_codon:yes stop_codon:yes gene_type:complete